MDTLFKKKSASRSSQSTEVGFSSVPYDRTSAASNPPAAIGSKSSSYGQARVLGKVISAPNTNRDLSADGRDVIYDLYGGRMTGNQQPDASGSNPTARTSTTSLASDSERLARTPSVNSATSAPSIRRVVGGGNRMDPVSESGMQQAFGLPSTPGSTSSTPSRPAQTRRDSEQESIRSNASSAMLASGRLGDFAPYPPHPRNQSQPNTIASRPSRSSSNANSISGPTLLRQDSQYPASTYSAESGPSSANLDNFHCPRPRSPGEIRRRCKAILESRTTSTAPIAPSDFTAGGRLSTASSGASTPTQTSGVDMSTLSLDMQWKIVYNAERQAYLQQRSARKDSAQRSPEWFIQHFVNDTVTPAIVQSLEVTLRTADTSFFQHFIEIVGVLVVAKALDKVNRPSQGTRRESDLIMEHELLKVFKAILNNTNGIRDVCNRPYVFNVMIYSLASPDISCRTFVSNMLFVVLVRSGAEAYRCIQEAFARWEAVVGTEAGGLRYEPWLRAVEAFLDGRGRMGSLVGASPEVRKAATGAVQFKESTLGDYYLYTVILINVLLKVPPDAVSRGGDLTRVVQTLEMRASVRLELQRCGVDRILNKLPSLGHSMVDREVQNYRDLEEEDRLQLTREYNRKLLKDLKNPQDVFNGLMANISGTKAQEFLLGILRQLMLIKDDGDRRLRHFQLVNELVRAVVHDGTGVDRDFSSVIDVSVQRILSKLEETELLEQAREENRDLKSRIIQLQRAKESMTAELAARDDGLVGQLKVQLADAETKLRVSRENGETMTTRIGELEEEIEYLKIELEGLYELLRETKSVEEILVRGKISDPDRRDFLANLETERERRKTIRILEGRHRKGGKKGAVAANGTAQSHFSDEEDDAGAEDAEDAEDGKVMVADKVALPEAKAKEKALAGNGRRKVVSGSQFEDAADERVKAHIEAQLASDELSPPRPKGSLPRSARSRDMVHDGRSSPRLGTSRPPAIGQKSPGRYAHLGIGRNPGLSRVMAELKDKHNGFPRSTSAPADLVAERESFGTTSESRGSAFFSETDSTAATPVSSVSPLSSGETARYRHLGQMSGMNSEGVSLKDQIAQRAQAMAAEHEIGDLTPADSKGTSVDEADGEEYPPPPPAPPLPHWLGGTTVTPAEDDGVPPPPPPPPPPPMPGAGLAGVPSPPGGAVPSFLAGIAAGVKLKQTGDGAPAGGSTFSRPARRVSKRYDASTLLHASDNRKAVGLTASKKMKQLQWEKLNKMRTDNTIWEKAEEPEMEIVAELQRRNIFSEMEDEFKAREIATDAMAKKKKEELKSVLEPSVRKRVEILMARTKKLELEPEQICDRILAFDPELCDSTFLFELQPVLPTPEQISLLKQQNAETPDELLLIHPADRLMIRLIKIPYLADRLKGMQFKVNFEETITLLEKEACNDLREAKQFKALLNVILQLGNYINGSNYAGGAWGFKLSSINRLVDTKSSNGQTLLHFLAKTISEAFPEIEGFLRELERPAEAYRVSYEELSSGTRELQTGLARIRRELETNFVSLSDGYARRMFPFVADAEERVLTLRDRVMAAGKAFNEVKAYYGEGDDRFDPTSNAEVFGRPTSLEFFGVFKTFVTSYSLCRTQNKAKEEAIASRERRRQAEQKRIKPAGLLSPQATGASDRVGIMDDLTARLRNQGTPRAKRTDRRRYDTPVSPIDDSFDWAAFTSGLTTEDGDVTGNSIAEAARRMLSGLDDSVVLEAPPDAPGSPTKAQAKSINSDPGPLTLLLPEPESGGFSVGFDAESKPDPTTPTEPARESDGEPATSDRVNTFPSPNKSRFAAATPELPALAEEQETS